MPQPLINLESIYHEASLRTLHHWGFTPSAWRYGDDLTDIDREQTSFDGVLSVMACAGVSAPPGSVAKATDAVSAYVGELLAPLRVDAGFEYWVANGKPAGCYLAISSSD